MRKNSLLLTALFTAFAVPFALGRGGDDDRPQQSAPVENLWFETDEIIYVPKFTFSLALRGLSGSKTSFSGTGYIYSPTVSIGNTTDRVARTYHDGSVSLDSRSDSANNYFNSADGKTNSWSYESALQERLPGFIAMNTYTANVDDSRSFGKDSGSTMGVEVAVSRDLGKLFGPIKWRVSAGLSLNDLRSKSKDVVGALINRTSDYYWLGGMAAPGAGYSAPSTTTVGSSTADSSSTGTLVDNTVLVGYRPAGRETSTTSSTTAVTNSWKLKGAYYTFRAGPTILWPITEQLVVSFGFGAAVAYAGATYSVDQELTPETGDPIATTVESSKTKVRPGYYIDANVEYWLSERAGFFAGGVYQNTGDYEQQILADQTVYKSKIDLSSLTGLRMGMNYKF